MIHISDRRKEPTSFVELLGLVEKLLLQIGDHGKNAEVRVVRNEFDDTQFNFLFKVPEAEDLSVSFKVPTVHEKTFFEIFPDEVNKVVKERELKLDKQKAVLYGISAFSYKLTDRMRT